MEEKLSLKFSSQFFRQENSTPFSTQPHFGYNFSSQGDQFQMSLYHLANLSGKNYGTMTLKNTIGSGSFGVVYLGECQGKQIAVKVSDDKDSLEKESALLKELIEVKGVCQWFGMELKDGISLMGMELGYMDMEKMKSLNPNKSFTPSVLQKVTHQISDALERIHSKGFAHRDMKLNNIVISQPNESLVVYAKIIDFGVARRVRNTDGSRVNKKETRFNFSKVMHATPYTVLGMKPDFIDDILQYSYSLIKATNDPMTRIHGSAYSRNTYKSSLLDNPETVLTPELAWLFPFLKAIGKFRPSDDIDYDLIRRAVQKMIPENDAQSNLLMDIVNDQPHLN